MRAIFEFTDDTWVELIWYVPVEGKFDFLACLFREPASGPWQLRCRFRHYDDDLAWDGHDHKSVYDIVATREDDPATIKQKLIETADMTSVAGAKEFGAEVHRIVVRGHARKAIKLLSRQSWTHRKEVPLPKTSDRVQ
jgi:hypothetical protein